MPRTSARLDALRARLAVPAQLDQAAALLTWDEATYLPAGGAEARGRQLANLARLSHEHTIDPGLDELVAELEGDVAAGAIVDAEAALVRETRRALDRARRVPADLVGAIAQQRVRGRGAWAAARTADDYAVFAPELRTMIALQRERAAALDGAVPAYDALLDEYERGATAAEVAALFGELRAELLDLWRGIQASPVRPDVAILHRRYPEAAQEAFVKETVAALGFDFERGRLDRTAHPFAMRVGAGDVRITTRYDARHLGAALFSSIHEAGHGMYEQNLPDAYADTPLGEPASLGFHESQSRLWENLVGRSGPYWEGAYPRLQAAFPGALDDVPVATFVAAINGVRPSLIRVEADEVTYHLHVMLRFGLERDLISGVLDVADLPAAWAEASRELLGVAPPDDRQGCLQDVHWSVGLFGYFPTYTLGTLLSVQLWEAMARDLGDLDDALRSGRFAPILAWLVEHVHRHGARFTPRELAVRATGGPLAAAPFLRYARAKYGALYRLG
jgi:carboxypeptidase Taq